MIGSRILALEVENFKRITVVKITPDGNVIEITGKNGHGKSSVLDSIEAALAGGKHLPGVPIRRGEKAARIRVEIGGEQVELVVERRFDEGGSKLVVETATGARKAAPQDILNALLGHLTFDPLAFTRMKPQEQFTALRALVTLDVDFNELDELSRGDFEKRTAAGREARALRAQAEGIVVADGLPAEKIDTKPILDRLTSASQHNSAIERELLRRAELARSISGYREQAKENRDKAAELRRQAEDYDAAEVRCNDAAEGMAATMAGLSPPAVPIDAAAVREELTNADAVNAKIDRRDRRAKLITDADAKDAEVTGYTEKIDARKEAKAKAIREAKMPIDGLSFGDSHVTMNGLPFDQASQAEQIRVSVAIAMAANPKLRVLRIKEGSFLDEDGMKLIAEMAAEHDYQVWVERVDSSGKTGIVLEDGHVKAPMPAPDLPPEHPGNDHPFRDGSDKLL
jgi:hypothetical protein